MGIEAVIALLSAVVIASYLFGMFSRWTGIPSVLLLLATGVAAQYMLGESRFDEKVTTDIVRFLGTIGLVMIVLEASLDLKLTREKIPLIRDALFSAAAILFITSGLLTILFHEVFRTRWSSAFAYAIPLSIISSAIAIPSATHLPEAKKEFVVYESSLSDILGILLFNFVTLNETIGAESLVDSLLTIVVVLLASFAATLLLVWITNRITATTKFFLLLAILFLLYSTGKIYHLPSLVLILTFGLTMNNIELLIHPRTKSVFDFEGFAPIVDQFRSITAESSFLIRTFFFIVFGFSISLASLTDPSVIGIGIAVVAILLGVRGVYFAYFLRANFFPEALLMPRGLITILLFYSIPHRLTLPTFDHGIVLFVIVATALLMTVGLVTFRKPAQRPS